MKKFLAFLYILISLSEIKADLTFVNNIRDIKVYSQLLLVNMEKNLPDDIQYLKKDKHLYLTHINVTHYQNIYNLVELNTYINKLYQDNSIILYSNTEPGVAIGLANYLNKKNPNLKFVILENEFD